MIVETVSSAEAAARPHSSHSLNTFDDRYALRHPLQIALCLRGMLTHRDFLIVEFDGRQIVTQVLFVDSRRAMFIFDCGGMPNANAALAAADKLVFRGQPGGIRTEFETGRAARTMFEDRPAFEVAFPAQLHYVQRREYYRVETPIAEPFLAIGRDATGEAFSLALQDMSLGGVALRTSDPRFAELGRGVIWRDVALQMGMHGEIGVDLEIVAPRQASAPNGEKHTVLGCRFIELSGIGERMVQRAITQLEMRSLGNR
jgi:flagellar brake protein